MLNTMSTRHFVRDAFDRALAARGWNLPTLAREIATNERYARSIAAGMVPGPVMRQKLAEALGVPADELFPLDVPTTRPDVSGALEGR